MKFYSRSDRPSTKAVPIGNGISYVYEERLDIKGVTYLERVGERDHHAFVQASLEPTKIYNILERFNAGDMTALRKTSGFFADVTALPKSFVEVHNFMSQLDANFDSLPTDLKSEFGNSPHAFMESVLSGNVNKVFDRYEKAKKVSPKDPENPSSGT